MLSFMPKKFVKLVNLVGFNIKETGRQWTGLIWLRTGPRSALK